MDWGTTLSSLRRLPSSPGRPSAATIATAAGIDRDELAAHERNENNRCCRYAALGSPVDHAPVATGA